MKRDCRRCLQYVLLPRLQHWRAFYAAATSLQVRVGLYEGGINPAEIDR